MIGTAREQKTVVIRRANGKVNKERPHYGEHFVYCNAVMQSGYS